MNEVSILDALRDPQMRHSAVVHLPIALSILGVLLALVAAVFRRNHTLRWVTFTAFALLAAASLLAVRSGEDAEESLSGLEPEAVHEIVERHEGMAQKVWVFASISGVLVAVSAVSLGKVRGIASGLAVVSSLFTAGWVGLTGHHGGTLVYVHGLGMPGAVPADPVIPPGEPGTGEPAADNETSAETPAETVSALEVDARLVFYREQVRPILIDSCMRCHNPVRARRSGGLDLTSMEAMLEGGMSGPAVVAGRPDDSWVVKAVRHEVEDLQMPKKKDKLAPEQIEAIEQWVADGAVWEAVAFEAPQREDGVEERPDDRNDDGGGE